MRIIVLGGGGFLGSALVDELAKEKSNTIQVVDIFTHGFPRNVKPRKNVEPWVSASITDARNVLRVMERFKPEVVFHLAAFNSRPESLNPQFKTCAEVNYLGTANVVHAVMSLNQRPKKLIFASTLAAQNPQMHFGISKRAAEDLILSILGRIAGLGVEPSILRFAEIYGPSAVHTSTSMANFLVDQMLLGPDIGVYSPNEKIDCLHISDAVQACKILAGAEKAPHLLDIGSGQGISTRDLCMKIKDLTKYAGRFHFHDDPQVPVQSYIADTAPAQEALGFSAQTDLDQGLAELVKKRRKVLT